MDLEKLVVPLILDLTKFTKGIDEANSKSANLVNGLSKIGGATVLGAASAAATGIGALTAYTIKSVQAASEAEDIQAQLNAVLTSTKGIAGVTADSVNALANKLSGLTKFEDDAIVSGQNMLLTFTNIGAGGGIFDQTTEIMLDMSQAMGSDLSSTAMQLGKALNDPTKGLTALTRVGVTFTAEQENMIKTLQETGDMAGAQQVILDELKKEFGGSARAAGKTFAGALTIARNSLGNVMESIGGKLLPILSTAANKFNTWINSKEGQAKIEAFGAAVEKFANKVIVFIPKAISTFQNIVTWLTNNKPIVLGILAALAVAVGIWAVQTAIAGWTAMAPFLPIIAILLGIAAVVALFAKAWESDFLGIKTKTTESFQTIVNFWNLTLKPVITAIGNWISTKLVPAFVGLGNAIGAVINFIKKMADGFKNIKLPKWLTPGSPFPFTYALMGMNKVLQQSANQILPQFSAQLNIGGNMPTLPNGNYSSMATNNKNNNEDIIKAIRDAKIDYHQLARALNELVLKEL